MKKKIYYHNEVKSKRNRDSLRLIAQEREMNEDVVENMNEE